MAAATVMPDGNGAFGGRVRRKRALLLVCACSVAAALTMWQVAFPELDHSNHRSSNNLAEKAPLQHNKLASSPATQSSDKVGRILHDLTSDAVRWIDTSTDPCEDFNRFTCGKFDDEWKDNIPGWNGDWGLSWDTIDNRTRYALRSKLQEDTGKAGTFYRSCTNVTQVEESDWDPVKPLYFAVMGVLDLPSLFDMIGMLQGYNVPVFFDWSVATDQIHPHHHLFYMEQAGITLPDPAYYKDPNNPKVKHLTEAATTMFKLTGAQDAELQAEAAMRVESILASFMASNAKMRVIKGLRTKFKVLQDYNPGFDWKRIFHAIGNDMLVAPESNVWIDNPEFFASMMKYMSKAEPYDIRAYLMYRTLKSMAPKLSSRWQDILFKLDQMLLGISQIDPVWRRCLQSTMDSLPHTVSALYYDKIFDKKAGTDAGEMIEMVRSTYNRTMAKEPWMTPEVVAVAQDKLSKALVAIGGPHEQNPKEEDFHVDSIYGDNFLQSERMKIRNALHKLTQPVNRLSWAGTGAYDVNAFYSRDVNVLYIPAAVLQSPMFSPDRTMAQNLGSAGAIFGHEFTHGFDDVGRQFDPNCRRQDWWPSKVVEEFTDRSQCIAEYYASFEVEGRHVNGNLTLAEDIADLGGLRMAYNTLSNINGGRVPTKQARQFFTSWSQVWCSVTRKAEARFAIRSDQHSPDMIRANAGVSLMPEFAAAFQCKKGSKMNPKEQCTLW